MGTLAQTVERTETDVPLVFTDENGNAGLTVVVAIRDGDSLTSALDFSDNTFKGAGWVARTAALSDISADSGAGFYQAPPGTLDLTAITNLPATTNQLIAEYTITGAITGVTNDYIQLADSIYTPPIELVELWQLAGLDAAAPSFVSSTVRTVVAAAIQIDITGVPATGVTLTRV